MASTSRNSVGAAAAVASGSGAGSAAGAPNAVAVPGACRVRLPRDDVPPALAEKPAGLHPGYNYKLVGWELDTTGHRLIDEMCQIAAFASPNKKFSQYIMPHGDLNPGARRRQNLRVVTVGRYRMLKDITSHKVVKTKSEISTLIDFITWLETIKREDEKIILMYYEPRRLHPTMLLQSLIRYHLFEQFNAIVAGFTDGYALSAAKCKDSFKSVSLRVVAKLLLDEGVNKTDTAIDRAIATYNIVEQLTNQEADYLDIAAAGETFSISSQSQEMVELACEFARPIHTEVEALEKLKELVARQNTFRKAFTPLLRAPHSERRRMAQLRRALVDAGLLYEQVKDAWHDGRRLGIATLLIPLEQTLSSEDIDDLVELFDNHFTSLAEPEVPDEPSIIISDDSDENMSIDSDLTIGPLSGSWCFSGAIPAAFMPEVAEFNLDHVY